ncbi:MAG TPA: alpha/beta hydrolase [Myxococcales bacterium]|jgi:pimeloyl-ACP methyl ester carboxylesterase|nr:alpha/beta hydrolase [Myxococcales bacterium]
MSRIALLLCCACAVARPAPVAAPEQLRFVEGPAGKLHVSDGGSGGTPVVFVHGLAGDLEIWRPQLDHLRETRRAVALDLRGHGQSDPPRDGNWTLEGLAEDLDAATKGLPRFVLVGHSMSGTVLQIFAARHPERLAGLVFVDAIGSLQRLGRVGLDELTERDRAMGTDAAEQRRAMNALFDANTRPATREKVLASFQRLPPEGFLFLRLSLFRFVVPQDLRATGIPLFAIEVERPRPSSIFFSALVPEAPRKLLPGVSHWPMADDPPAFNAALDSFLATLR